MLDDTRFDGRCAVKRENGLKAVRCDDGRESRSLVGIDGFNPFTRNRYNEGRDILFIGFYHKYWLDQEHKIRNPRFNENSRMLLDLKESKEGALRYFYGILNHEIPKEVSICVVPSCTAGNFDTGIARLGKMLADNGRVDKVCFLERMRSIPKLSTGGRRSKELHRRTIKPLEDMSVEGETVVLLDDVATTGNSLWACRDILMRCGAREVKMVALGLTCRSDQKTAERACAG